MPASQAGRRRFDPGRPLQLSLGFSTIKGTSVVPVASSAPSPQAQKGEISPGKTPYLSRTTAGSTGWLLGRYGFAVCGPLALTHHALYPVPVRRLASLPRASTHLTVTPLRFASARGLLTQRTFTSWSRAMLGAPQKKARPVTRAFSLPMLGC
jgi:hypothetical protein